MKNFLNAFTVSLLCAAVTSPLYANYQFSPEEIFEQREGGKVTLPTQTTFAHELHKEGIQGKGFLAAIIDHSFHPKHTAELTQNGRIHPAAFSDQLILAPDTSESDLLEKFSDGNTHGSRVMEAIHLIAPQAQLLPIDVLYGKELQPLRNAECLVPLGNAECLVYGIRKAIQYGADVINISRSVYCIPEMVEACQEAIDRRIPIFISAGNDSIKDRSFLLDEMWNPDTERTVWNPKQDLFHKLGGKGIYFVGAVKYGEDGTEKVANYSQHPTDSTETHFIWAAGNNLPARANIGPKLVKGTSFSTPVTAAAYLVLKEFARKKGYTIDSYDLVDILYASGRDVTFDFHGKKKIYKSMDLRNAKLKIEEMYKPIPQSVTPVTSRRNGSLKRTTGGFFNSTGELNTPKVVTENSPVTSRRNGSLKRTVGMLNIKANPAPIIKPASKFGVIVPASVNKLPEVSAQPVAFKPVTPEPVVAKKKWAPVVAAKRLM